MIRLVPPARLASAGKVASAFDLSAVELVQLTATQKKRITDTAEGDWHTRYSDEVAVEAVTPDYASCLVTMHVMSGAEGDPRAGCFELTIVVRAHFSRVPKIEIAESDISEFLALNGLFAAWPYLREIASSTVVRMGFPPFVLDPLVLRPEPSPEAVEKHRAEQATKSGKLGDVTTKPAT